VFRRLFLALPWAAGARAQDQALAEARRRIDAVDQRLVAVLNERARIVDEVSRIKKARKLPVSDPRRFQEVIDKAASYSKGPLPPDAVKRIYARLVEVMQSWEATR
jgi:chorismate mutase / prephenate dehydratase